METEYIGSNILEFLRKQNKTQVDLANGINSSKQVVNKIIKGKNYERVFMLLKEKNEISVDEIIEKTGITKQRIYVAIQYLRRKGYNISTVRRHGKHFYLLQD